MRIVCLSLLVAGCLPTPEGDPDTEAIDDSAVDTEVEASEIERVCRIWTDARDRMYDATFTGNVGTCSAGTLGMDGLDAALEIVNAYRALADLPLATMEASRSAKAQECALVMVANQSLSHTPPSNWQCYTSAAYDGASHSNIHLDVGSGTLLGGLDGFIVDGGANNRDVLGHRRWILSNQLDEIGFGAASGPYGNSTLNGSCLWVFPGTGSAGEPWTAWPPPGVVPLEVFELGGQYGGETLDDTGWSVQGSAVSLSMTAKVTRDGVDKPVRTDSLGSQPESNAVAIRPQGWSTSVGRYDVVLGTGSSAIEYGFDVVDCDSL